VRLLLGAGADTNLGHDESGRTPLILAVERGAVAPTEQLLEAGADTETENKEGKMPLLLAALKGHVPVMRLLLAKDADLVKEDPKGSTPLS
jgi:ankyrin repeat protein